MNGDSCKGWCAVRLAARHARGQSLREGHLSITRADWNLLARLPLVTIPAREGRPMRLAYALELVLAVAIGLGFSRFRATGPDYLSFMRPGSARFRTGLTPS